MRNKFLNVPIGVLENRVFGKVTPLIVSFLVTYRCNQYCEYCNWSALENHEISTDEALTIINQVAAAGTYKIGFTGGEALVRKDIDILMKRAKELGLIVSLASNGRAVPDHYEAIDKYVDILHVSLDGPEHIHDKNRSKGSYSAAVEAIKIAKKMNKKVVANMVLTKDTISYVPYVVDMAKKMDFDYLFQPVFEYKVSSKEEKLKAMAPSKEILRKTMNYLILEKKKGGPIGNSITLLKHIREMWPNGKLKKCYAGSLFTAINPDGEIVPCCFLEDIHKWPNAKSVGFKEAFLDKSGRHLVDNCSGCFCNAYLEASLLMGLDISACMNYVKRY